MSDAILEEYTVEENLSGMRLDKFLTEIYPQTIPRICRCEQDNTPFAELYTGHLKMPCTAK